MTLFWLLNGDVIHVFDDRYCTYPSHSTRPCLASSTCTVHVHLPLFIDSVQYAVLNIFIAIIEDAFFASKAFQLHGQPELEDKEKTDQVDPLLLLEF
mgnify:CR=1 FL=1